MNTQLNIAICEDLEQEQIQLLSILENNPISCTTTIYCCGEDFLSDYQPGKFDLIFMDIYMNQLTGIEVIQEIRNAKDHTYVAFTTTSLEHALESYRLDALKYIEKPLKPSSVNEILQIALLQKENVPKLNYLINGIEKSIPLKEIIYLEQQGSNFIITTTEQEQISIKGKLSAQTTLLNNNTFYHCHKSYIVNFTYVISINKELFVFEMINKINVHISRDGFWKTKRAFENYLFEKSREASYE